MLPLALKAERGDLRSLMLHSLSQKILKRPMRRRGQTVQNTPSYNLITSQRLAKWGAPPAEIKGGRSNAIMQKLKGMPGVPSIDVLLQYTCRLPAPILYREPVCIDVHRGLLQRKW